MRATISSRLLTISDAMQVSRLSRSTLYTAMQAGELPFIEPASGLRRRLIRRECLAAYLGVEERDLVVVDPEPTK